MEKSEFKRQIRDEIEKTKKKIEVLVDLTQPISPENAIGRVSRMDAINNKSINEASLRQAQSRLQKLEQALINVDEKSFGICIGCGEAIPAGRLMLMPESNKCVKCA